MVWNQGVLPLDGLPLKIYEPHLPELGLNAALTRFDDPVLGHMRHFVGAMVPSIAPPRPG